MVLFLILTTGVATAAAPEDISLLALRDLSSDEVRQQLIALRAEIARHDSLYHVKAAPEISDAEYDQLKRRLRQFEAAFPGATAMLGGAIAGIGDDRTGLFRVERHREPMLSLEKAYTEAEVRTFDTRLAKLLGHGDLAYVIEPKFDGLAVSVTYERGSLVRAVTRGNGLEGDDITANVAVIRTLPRTLRTVAEDGDANPIPDLIELRGEIHVSWAEFRRLNAEREASGESAFATPRNLAAGTVRQLNAESNARRNLEIVFYGVGACVPDTARPSTQHDLHRLLGRWGLPHVKEHWTARGVAELWTAVQALGRARSGFAFPTDGAVVKLDDMKLQREVGATESAPRWALAYKFAPPRRETRVLGITVQVGRTGVLTPVAELEPIELAGSTVARATLHNREEIVRQDIRVGDVVIVEKAGEIVPAIVGVNTERRTTASHAYVFPETCPACGAALEKETDEVAIRCPNADCTAQVRRRIEHFASANGVGIDGLGPAMIAVLVDKGLINDAADLYRLKHEDLLVAGRNAGPSADRLLAAIEASKRVELWRLINAIGIPQIGVVSSQEAARRFGSLAALADADGKGDAMSRAIAAYLAEARNRTVVERLIAAGVQPRVEGAKGGHQLGKVFVLTGTLQTLTRAQATARIESAGGKVADTVTGTTRYVVAGRDPGSKLEQARTLGVGILDEVALLRLLDRE